MQRKPTIFGRTLTDSLEMEYNSWKIRTTFVISFSGSSDTNNDSLLQNTSYIGSPRLRYLFQVFQTQTRQLIVAYYLHWNTMPRLRYLLQVFQTQTRQLIVEYYLHWTTTFEISFSGSSDTNHSSLLKNTTYTRPPRLRESFRAQTTTAYI